MWLGPAKDPLFNSSYYSWACHSVVFVWKRGIRVIVLKRKCFMYISSILMFWLFCRTSDSFYWWWGIAQPMDAPSEVTRCNGRSYRGISITFVILYDENRHHWTFEHALLQKNMYWSYVSPYYLLEFTTFAVDHEPNASLSCAFTTELQAQL